MGQKMNPDKRSAGNITHNPAQNYCGTFSRTYNRRMKSAVLLSLIGFLFFVPTRPVLCAEAAHDHHSGQWEKDIAAFEARDKTNPPPANGILFIGSSTIRFWTTLATDFPGQPVINRGFGGSE